MNYLSSFVLNIKIQLLFLFNKILRRDLEVKFVSLNSAIITKDTEIGIFWEVRGCYKIVIENSIILPGNVQGFNFIFNGSFDTLFITFYGTEKIYSETLSIRSNTVEILNSFEHNTILPYLKNVPINSQNYILGSNYIWKPVISPIIINNIEALPQKNIIIKKELTNVQLDKFNILNYPKTNQ